MSGMGYDTKFLFACVRHCITSLYAESMKNVSWSCMLNEIIMEIWPILAMFLFRDGGSSVTSAVYVLNLRRFQAAVHN